MCFSPTASFTASALLGVAGVASVIKTREKKMVPFAVIPLIFAIQQGIEGGLWLTILGKGTYTAILTSLFLFFALFWWPVFAPFTVYLVEKVQWRRRFIGVLTAVGLVLGSYLYISYLMYPGGATIQNLCIYYDYSVPYSIVGVELYLLVTVGAGLLSSRRVIAMLYMLIGALAFFAWREYFDNFTSVWCFFAAVVSALVYYVVNMPPVKKKVKT